MLFCVQHLKEALVICAKRIAEGGRQEIPDQFFVITSYTLLILCCGIETRQDCAATHGKINQLVLADALNKISRRDTENLFPKKFGQTQH